MSDPIVETLHWTTDAMVWTEEFKKAMTGLCVNTADVDKGFLVGWFANAIEIGRDAGKRMQINDLDVLLTELLIFANALSERELKTMSTPAFNALMRVAELADRIDDASRGGATTAQSRKDSLRERRDGQVTYRSGMVQTQRGRGYAVRNHDSEEAGFVGMVERSSDAPAPPDNTYESEDAAGDPTVINRDEERSGS